MNIKCPHCKVDFNSEDIAHTLKKGHFICPVCEKKIPSSSSADKLQSTAPLIPKSKYIIPVSIILAIAASLAVFYFSKSSDKIIEKVNPVAPKITEPGSNPVILPR